MTSNTRKKGNSDKTLGILLSKFEKNYYARCVYNLDSTWLRGYMATRLSSKGTARLIYQYMYTVWLYIDIH